MAGNRSWQFDAAGWVFWVAVFVVLVGPCTYLGWKVVYKDAGRFYPFGIGIASAAIGAGMVSWAVNAVLQRRAKRRARIERKKAKKRK